MVAAVLALLPHHFACAVDLTAAIKQKHWKGVIVSVAVWLGIALLIAFFIWIYFIYPGIGEYLMTEFLDNHKAQLAATVRMVR